MLKQNLFRELINFVIALPLPPMATVLSPTLGILSPTFYEGGGSLSSGRSTASPDYHCADCYKL